MVVGLLALDPGFVAAPWTLLTSVCAHTGPGHLLGNLLGLALFGGVVERVSSRARVHAFVVSIGVRHVCPRWPTRVGVPPVALRSPVNYAPDAALDAIDDRFGEWGIEPSRGIRVRRDGHHRYGGTLHVP